MDFEIRILPRAKLEIEEAIAWYSSKKLELGKELSKEINLVFDLLRFDPFLFNTNRKNYRQVPLKRFPYVIIYRVFENEILVQSVFNTHQNPTKKP